MINKAISINNDPNINDIGITKTSDLDHLS